MLGILKKNLKLILIIFIISFLFFQIKTFINNIQISGNYYVQCDSLFSNDLRHNIIDFINENLKFKKPKDFWSILKSNFPMIQSIKLNKKNPNLTTVSILSSKPLYQINDDLIFTKNKELYSKEIFNQELINDLKNWIVNDDPFNNDFLDFANQIEPNINQNYKINWLNKNLIKLQSYSDDNFVIFIKHNKIPNQEILDLCKKLKQEKNENKKNIITDLRFSNQILLSKI